MTPERSAPRATESIRPYSSPLRERQKDLTKELVFEALLQILGAENDLNFSVQQVADRAGVSHQTVYRHFTNRDALLRAFYDWGAAAVERAMGDPSILTPTSIEDFPRAIAVTMQMMDEDPAIPRALIAASGLLGIEPESRARRSEAIRDLVRRVAPNLSDAEVKQAFAVIRTLASARSWATMRDRYGLTKQEVSTAVGWAVATLVKDLEDRNRQAGRVAKGAGSDGQSRKQ